MSSLTRREVLAALAAAGAAPIWLELGSGCGRGRGPAAPGASAAPGRPVADLRQQLRQVVAGLERAFPVASALAEVGSLRRIRIDEAAQAVNEERASRLVLAASDGTSWFEQATFDLSPGAIDEAAAALAARARAGGRASSRPLAATTTPAAPMRLDPRRTELARWIERVTALHERTRGLGGSRIVYRAASLEVEDSDRLFVGEGRDQAHRVVRSHARVLFLAWDGETLLSEEASRAGALGLEAADIPPDDLEEAVAGALSLLTGRAAAAGERDLVLDPTVAAMVLRHGVAAGLMADDWIGGGAHAASLAGKTVAPASLTLRDVPAAAAFGARAFDDEGWPAAPVALIERGVLRGPLTCRATAAALGLGRTGHARRPEGTGPAAPRPGHLELAPGSSSPDQLVASVSDGFLVESGVGGRGDPRSWRFAVQARRAREIARGRLTGRSYGPVVVGGAVAALLGAARAVGNQPRMLAWRDPAPVSVSAPHLVTRAWLGRGS